jgi:hypothetical protein
MLIPIRPNPVHALKGIDLRVVSLFLEKLDESLDTLRVIAVEDQDGNWEVLQLCPQRFLNPIHLIVPHPDASRRWTFAVDSDCACSTTLRGI